jgi:hypothetical protein
LLIKVTPVTVGKSLTQFADAVAEIKMRFGMVEHRTPLVRIVSYYALVYHLLAFLAKWRK